MAVRADAASMVQYFTSRNMCPECRTVCGGGWTMDGLWVLCAVELGGSSRSVYPGLHGEVLYSYPNNAVLPPEELFPAPVLRLERKIEEYELESLQEAKKERDRLRLENAGLRYENVQLHARLDRLESGAAGDPLVQARAAAASALHEAATERAMRKQLIGALHCTELELNDRVIAAAAIDTAHAYRLAPEFGGDAAAAVPVRVRMGALAQQLGVSPKAMAPALEAAAAQGLLTRDVRMVGGEETARMEVWIGPPTGAPAVPYENLRRKKDRERKQRARETRKSREAELTETVAELEAAAHTGGGCRGCGHELLPTGYFCPACQLQYAPAAVAEAARAPDSMEEGAGPYGADSAPSTIGTYGADSGL